MRTHRSILGCSLAVLAVALAATGAAAFDQDRYEQAVAAFQAGDWAEAATGFEALVDENPEWAGGRVILGQTYLLLGRADDGRKQLTIAKEIDPSADLFAAYAAAGQELVKRDKFAEAADAFQAALEVAPPERRASMTSQLASALQRAERYEDARRMLHRTIEQGSGDPALQFQLALTCRRLEDYDCAVQQLRSVQETGQDPSQGRLSQYLAEWSYERAMLPQNQSQREELLAKTLAAAEAWHDQAPDDPEARRILGDTLLALGRPDEVILAFQPLADQNPADCDAALMMSRADNARGDAERAEQYARRAIECDARSADAHVELAMALLGQIAPESEGPAHARADLERARAARAELETAAELEPASPPRRLQDETAAIVSRLEVAAGELRSVDPNGTDELAEARDAEITDRCLAIVWERRDPSTAATPEDDVFWTRNDCARRVREFGIDPS